MTDKLFNAIHVLTAHYWGWLVTATALLLAVTDAAQTYYALSQGDSYTEANPVAAQLLEWFGLLPMVTIGALATMLLALLTVYCYSRSGILFTVTATVGTLFLVGKLAVVVSNFWQLGVGG